MEVSPKAFKSRIISIFVGPTKQLFSVHEDLLKKHSKYFRTALESKFEEAKSRSFRLEEEDPLIFGIFAAWLYCGKLVIEDENTKKERPVNEGEALESWVLGDRRGVFLLQNQAINAWRDYMIIEGASEIRAQYIFDNTGEGSKLRKLYVDSIAYETSFKRFEQANTDDYPKELLLALLARLASIDWEQRKNKSWLNGVDLCAYHEHPDGKKCSSGLPKTMKRKLDKTALESLPQRPMYSFPPPAYPPPPRQ